jgi:hypothetical protein
MHEWHFFSAPKGVEKYNNARKHSSTSLNQVTNTVRCISRDIVASRICQPVNSAQHTLTPGAMCIGLECYQVITVRCAYRCCMHCKSAAALEGDLHGQGLLSYSSCLPLSRRQAHRSHAKYCAFKLLSQLILDFWVGLTTPCDWCCTSVATQYVTLRVRSTCCIPSM